MITQLDESVRFETAHQCRAKRFTLWVTTRRVSRIIKRRDSQHVIENQLTRLNVGMNQMQAYLELHNAQYGSARRMYT